MDPVLLRAYTTWGFDTRGWAPSTRQLYAGRVRACHRYLNGQGVSLLRATEQAIYSWLTTLPPTASSRNVSRQALHAFYEFLRASGRRASNPLAAVPALRYLPSVPKALDLHQVRATIVAADEAGPQWSAAWSVMLHSALRATEARTLEWDRIDGRWVTFVAKGGAQRVVPLHAHSVERLLAWRASCPDPRWVFPSPVKFDAPVAPSTFRRWVREVGEAAGVPGLHPHVARHTCATGMVESGVDVRSVQEVLGHSSLQTTQRYVRARPLRLVQAVQAVPWHDDAAA